MTPDARRDLKHGSCAPTDTWSCRACPDVCTAPRETFMGSSSSAAWSAIGEPAQPLRRRAANRVAPVAALGGHLVAEQPHGQWAGVETGQVLRLAEGEHLGGVAEHVELVLDRRAVLALREHRRALD